MILRSILLVLLCMNIGAAIWWASQAPVAAASFVASTSDVPSLTLLAEVERRENLTPIELNAAPEPLERSPICLNLGPFDTPQALRKATEVLGPQVGRLQYREAQIEQLRGYRVFLPATETRAEALSHARYLADRGVRDYYVVTAGDAENTLALGLFREKANAERRLAEIIKLGVKAKMEATTEQRPQWWLEIAIAEGFDWRAALAGAGKDLKEQSIPCL